ncbi:hypothetical protein COU16_00205 [Candidatus Kaiserbacteria bacterium CG10_big_fil_rev_8_21_14_0_10_47_16]|uniref:UDP-N-acetylenolpyruvoylglucosamine reductase n=1 Tax=Candidatus Kaiserbacteria bacterium CG10_big_fil_rev_8_21_14_0_10_47_16 TaxID=1974608 RepID=A0A2H0UES4_9BACT|nr:MAG: hypothetical protein COU16_00205 [Candidatus Kaiserbacteria bacterium CG10_big_fil_rev_8_21_14_0_10_47_16]
MEIQKDVSLAAYTTFHIGGPADFFVSVASGDELQEAYQYGRGHDLPVRILGGGSNVLIPDEGIRGLVIHIGILGTHYSEEGDDVLVTAGAGVVWDELVADTVTRGLWGLENLSAIPGTVGATPVQNVGAYGAEVADSIVSVRAYDTTTDTFIELTNNECQFGYRDSLFKTNDGKRYIVVSCTYRVSKNEQPKLSYKDLAETFGDHAPTVEDVREAVVRIRAGKFPDWNIYGTAGSFFKNPIISREVFTKLQTTYPDIPSFEAPDGMVKIPLGYVLDAVLAFKGVREGSVGTYEKQALVIVNYGDASFADVDAFAKIIEQKVFEATGIMIEREVRVLK